MKSELIGTGLALIGIGISLMLALPPPWWPKMPPSIIHTGVLSGLILTLIGASIVTVGAWPNLPEGKIAPLLLMLCGLLFLVAGAAWYFWPVNPKDTQAIESDHRPSLLDLFNSDFPYGHIDKEVLLKTADGGEVKALIHVFYDFNGRSSFLGFYLPRSTMTFEACAYIGQNYKLLYDDIINSISVGARYAGDVAMTFSKDLVFSGRIYVYYEDDLSMEQLGVLAALYRQHGVDFQPRGGAYLTTQWLSRQNQKPKN
jgi:hypothetical protein